MIGCYYHPGTNTYYEIKNWPIEQKTKSLELRTLLILIFRSKVQTWTGFIHFPSSLIRLILACHQTWFQTIFLFPLALNSQTSRFWTFHKLNSLENIFIFFFLVLAANNYFLINWASMHPNSFILNKIHSN